MNDDDYRHEFGKYVQQSELYCHMHINEKSITYREIQL